MAYTKEEFAAYHRAWTIKNRDKRRAANKRWRDNQLAWYNGIKAGLKCNRCSETHTSCLEFHHKDPKVKEMIVSVAARSWGKARILKEIAKCEVLCSNCHRKHHYEERNMPG